MRDQRGMALPLTLLILLVLTSITMAVLAVGSSEPVIARNLVEGTQARLAAEAGVEFAYNQLVQSADWNTDYMSKTDGSGLMAMATVVNIPTTAGGMGTYTVTVRNDDQAGDNLLTGAVLDAGGPKNDSNGRVIITSVGTVNGATKTLRVVIRRTVLPPFPAGLNFPGNEAETNFNGNSFMIDGNDKNADDTLGSCPPAYGISVSPTLNLGLNETIVQTSLTGPQKDNITGKKQDPAGTADGDNTIAPEPVLTPEVIAEFIGAAKANADVVLQSKMPSGLSFSNIGSSCASSWSSNTCWGTSARPKIVYVKGDADPTSMFSALQLSGTTEGHGILIVEDGDLRLSGNFAWYGPVIVTGRWVGIGFMGGGWQTVYGSVISNETSTDPGFNEGWVSGNAKVQYSCQQIDKMRKLKKLVTMSSWQELPN